MATRTNIQWCEGTVNPVMGCGGCELWPMLSGIREAVLAHLEKEMKVPVNDRHRECVAQAIRESGGLPTDVCHRRHDVAAVIVGALSECSPLRTNGVSDALARVNGRRICGFASSPAEWAQSAVSPRAIVNEMAPLEGAEK